MKKGTTIILIILISISGYLIYDLFLFDYLNNMRLEQKKVELVDNYYKNETSFKNFSSLIKEIGNVDNLEFYEPNQISFSIYSKNHDSYNDVEPWFIDIISDNVNLKMDFRFNKDDSINMSFNDTIEKNNAWHFYVDTNLNDKRIIQLLEYIDVTPTKLSLIKKELSNLNCKALTKNNQLIKFRYAGHFGESLDYIIPFSPNNVEFEIVKIKDQFHYGITYDIVYCGITKW